MTFLLAHLSDAHIGPIPRPNLRELLGKRVTGYMNWGRRVRIHDMDVLEELVADMKAQQPDHIAMTGDILNLGLAAEFPLAATWLRSLGDPQQVSFVPGNHDAYVRTSMPRLARTFVPWLADLGPEGLPHVGPIFPYLRRRGEVALIGVSSAVPSGVFMATGMVGATQLEALGPLLAAAEREGLARVVLIHHPPYRGGAKAGRHLRDAGAFSRVIATYGADLVLHGHNHRPMLAHLPGPKGPVPVVGVPSASAVPGSATHRAAYHLFAVARNGAGFSITARRRGLSPMLDGIVDLGAFTLAETPDEPHGI